ncbi:MAG TPA: putative phosphothreonine lyase domain-containing protein [Methanospirillum sp.]|nr:putative phosphothreonine lyase domain-containing protein [Methanospirillum sp.]
MDSEMEALADIAYGLFESFLNKELNGRKTPLFQLVEGREDFQGLFITLFRQFREIQPEVTKHLETRFPSPDDMYRLILHGEGIVPSETVLTQWVVQDAPETGINAIDSIQAGKWLIFVQPDLVDNIWFRIRDMTWRGELGISSKASTAKPNPDSRDERRVIYVYTADWEDEPDVMRIREQLRACGVEERIGYKRNIETQKGEYAAKGKKVTFYSA